MYMTKFKITLAIVFVSFLIGCKKVKEGEWKADNTLSVLCATEEAKCSNEAQVLCYSDNDELVLLSINEFAKIAKFSISVCFKDGKVLDEKPSCESKTTPVCGFKRDVSESISSVKPVCTNENIGISVVCPFGGKPVCLKQEWDLVAYCVNDKNFIISDTWSYYQSGSSGWPLADFLSSRTFQEFGGIACSDKKSVPRCYNKSVETH